MNINMSTARFWKARTLALVVCLPAALTGCVNSSKSLIAISPSTTQTMDAGQSLPILVSVVNDSAHRGSIYTLSGPGTLATGALTPVGDSDKTTVTYTAPSTVPGPTTVIFTATTQALPAQTVSLTILINPALVITTTSLPAGTVASAYSATLASSGGTGVIKWGVTSGTLPTGLALNTLTGVISGTPSAAGTYTFTIGVTDSATTPNTVTQAYTVLINPQPPVITTTSLPNAVAGIAYSQQLTYSGGSGTPTWAITGNLPAGLTLSTSGLISGTPTNASAGATYPFTVTVTTGTQTSPAQPLSITVPALPAVATKSLPSGNIGIPYSYQLTYTGGAGGTVSWAITSGSLPTGSGLTLSSSGLISGTPTAATTYTFSVAVTVGTQTSASQPLTLVINSLIITSGASASGEVGLAFNFPLTAAGGTGPYTWSLATGSNPLPTGLTLNATTGLITGLPATSTGSPFTGIVVQAKDSLAATATQAMTFTVNPARTNVNNAELSGQYAFLLSGFDANGKPLTTAGKFVADGNGNITSGVIDINGTGLTTPTTNAALIANSYSIGTDNRGKITLNTATASATFVLAADAMASGVATSGYINEFDATGQRRSGTFALQTPAAFTTASITGGYAFGLSGFAANATATSLQHRSTIGELQFNGVGGINSAELLASATGSNTPVVPTSAAIAIGTNGRGTLALTLPSGGGTLNFAIYVVSASKAFLISTDPASGTTGINDLLTGQALQQTTLNGNFNAASLNGTSVYREQKSDLSKTGTYFPDAQIGLYTFNGTGKATASGDENAGGTPSTVSLAGTYTVAPNGRTSATLGFNGIGGCTDCVTLQTYFYLVGSNQGFVMDFSTPTISGYFEPQTATTISASSFSGTYATGTLEPLAQNAAFATGIIASTGSGLLSETIDLDAAGTLAPDTALTGTYVVAASGRTAITQTGASPILYIISTTKALSLDLASPNPVIQEVLHQ